MAEVSASERDELLAHFQAITGQQDLDECRACLEAHRWNLDEAVQSALAHHDAPMAQHFGQNFSDTAATFGRQHDRGAADAPPPGPAASPDSRGWFHSLTGVPLWNVMSSAVRIASFGAIHPDGQGAANLPPEQIQRFVDELEREFGQVHPNAHIGTFRSAMDKAKAEFKFLIVYLHSPHHEDTPQFCRETLCTQTIKEFIDDNFIFWMGSILSSEAYTASQLLRAASFPFVAVLTTTTDNRTTVCDAHQGPVKPEDLMNWLTNIMDTQGPHLVAQRAEWEERALDRRLREEQDAAFHQSLLEDQERERAAAEAERERLRAEEEVAAMALSNQEAARQRAEDKERKRRFFMEESAEPSQDDAAGVVHIAIRLPSGVRLQRRFRPSDLVQSIYDYVDGCGDLEAPVEGTYHLASSFPKRILADTTITLEATGLSNQAMLFLQEAD